MPFARSGNAKIYYETLGKPSAPAMLFIGGFTAQLIGWQEEFCRLFVERGFQVIRFDHRDCGLSQRFDGSDGCDPVYTLHDMAADAFAILDELEIDRAHVVGQSMGGMIAQSLAAARPDRVLSLTLVFTAPYVHERYFPTLKDVSEMVFDHADQMDFVGRIIEEQRLNATDVYPLEETWIRRFAERSYERGYSPAGVKRQLRAMLTKIGEPFADHARLTMPVVLIHGHEDIRVRVGASIELAQLIPHAELHLYPGMGHWVVAPLWHEFADIITRTMRRSEKGVADFAAEACA